MADISVVSRLVNGLPRNVNLNSNSLLMQSLKLGSGSELTQAILDKLLSMQSVARADGKYDATNIVVAATPANYTPGSASVEAHLAAIDSALATAGVSSFDDAIFEIVDNGDATKKLKFEVSGITTGTTRTITMPDSNVNLGLIATAIQSSEKGANNGVATLDAGGKIPVAQLPNSVMELQGFWNASTNTPSLVDGTGNPGDVYEISVAGTRDFGNGAITFAVGDWAVYAADNKWHKSLNSNEVTSVNGQTGTVVLNTSHIAENTNLYFTAARAKLAAVADSITDGVTDVAPSQNAVFDALALKQAASANLDEADTFFGLTNITGTEAETLSNGANADSLHEHACIKESGFAGEALSATTIYALRYAKATDAGFVAGRLYKADITTSVDDLFYVIGLVKTTGALTAGDATKITKSGTFTVAAHGFAIGAPIFLDTAGALTNTAPSASGTAVVRVAVAKDINTLEVQIQVMGVN